MNILPYLLPLTLFIGYIIGRWSHWYLNDKVGNPGWAPHHWIWGVILIFLGFILRDTPYRWHLVAFGLGLFISDLKDFFLLRFFRPDDPGPKRFWHID